MKCPRCGLYHPPQYGQCVSCGSTLGEGPDEPEQPPVATTQRSRPIERTPIERPMMADVEDDDDEVEEESEGDNGYSNVRGTHKTVRRSKVRRKGPSGPAVFFGIFTFVCILLVFAGATIFLLTKPPDDQQKYDQGMKQIANGEFAFAVESLSDAAALRPKDARIYLALARAYVGVDQIQKAWECISQAQNLGANVASEPALASDLANYYRQRGEYEKAINLLRPLAKAEVPGKRAQLADIDAMWGDDAMRDGKLDLALRCWEEVRDLNDGSRASEAQTRLATIYQKLANTLATDNDSKNDGDALKYLNKLNNIAQNPKNFVMAADLYEKQGQLELAIDQLRKAEKLGDKSVALERKLAGLLSRRGKELLDEGSTDTGYAYLQQAKSISPEHSLPAVALREMSVGFEPISRMPRISGRVWNPTDKSVNSLTMRVELFDTKESKVLWTKDQKIIDDFVPPLGAQESKAFDIVAEKPSTKGASEFRVYLDGNLYKTYPIGKSKEDEDTSTASAEQPTLKKYSPLPRALERDTVPPLAPQRPSQAPAVSQPPAEPAPQPSVGQTQPHPNGSAEEQTMKDLDQ